MKNLIDILDLSNNKNIIEETMKREKTKTNYRIRLTIGKALERATIADGKGFASLEEAKKMFDSLRKGTKGVLKAELYFEDKLIKRV